MPYRFQPGVLLPRRIGASRVLPSGKGSRSRGGCLGRAPVPHSHGVPGVCRNCPSGPLREAGDQGTLPLSPSPISFGTPLATRLVTVFAIKRPEPESKPALSGKSGGSVAHNRPPSTRFLAPIRFDQRWDSDLRGLLRITGTGLPPQTWSKVAVVPGEDVLETLYAVAGRPVPAQFVALIGEANHLHFDSVAQQNRE